MADDDFFAPPPFKAHDGHERLRRELREAGLHDKGGVFEWRGLPVARAVLDGPHAINVALAKVPARSPQWLNRTLRNSAELRDWLAQTKKHLAQWSDRDE
jgi:hypothetical protein